MKNLTKICNLILLSVLFYSCREKIDAGNEGILVNQYGSGKGQGVSLVAGATWYNPMTEDVFQFPLFVQNADFEPFQVSAKDGSIFEVAPRVAYKVEQGKAPEIFKKYRKPIEEIQDQVLLTYTRDAFRVVFGKYSTDYILTNRDSIESAIESKFSSLMRKEGFQVEQMTYSLTPSASIQNSINLKNEEVAKSMRVENELKTAEARARIKIVEARAEKEANELRQASLTPLLIQQQFISKWGGKTPLYGESPVMFKSVK